MRWLLVVFAACSYSPEPATAVDPSDGPLTDGPINPIDSDAPAATGIVADPFSNSSTGGFSNALQLQHTVGPGGNRLLLVGLSISFAGTQAISVTYDGTALTRIGARDAPSADGRVEIWSLVAPPSGTHAVQILVDDATSTMTVGVASYANVDQTTPLGPFVSAVATANNPTLAVPSADGEHAFNVVMWNGGHYSNLTAGASQQSEWNRNTTGGTCCSIVGAGATATHASPTFTWTVGGGFDDFWSIGAVTIRPD